MALDIDNVESHNNSRVVRESLDNEDSELVLVVQSAKELILEELNHTTKVDFTESLRACLGALDLLQEDTLLELQFAQTLEGYRKKLTNKEISRTERVNMAYGSDVQELEKSIERGHVIFILISNTFNRLDELGETAISKNNRDDEQAIGADFLHALLEKARVSDYVASDGVKKRVSFQELIGHIKKLAEIWEIDTSNWSNLINKIVEGQSVGMKMVAESRKQSRISYTVEESLRYRHSTIGNYARLLADTGCMADQSTKEKFIVHMMEVQAGDDKTDILEDEKTQVNPYLALLQKHGLVDKFREYITINNKDIYNLNESDLGWFAGFVGGRLGLSFFREASQLSKLYKEIN